MNAKWIVMAMLCLLMAGCAADPRNEAEAQATISQAQQAAEDARATREQKQAEAQLKLKEREAMSQQWIESVNTFIKWMMYFAIVASALVMLSASGALGWAFFGLSRAFQEQMAHQAQLIHMDENTRQFPLLLHHNGKGLFTAVDMNTGAVADLDVRNAGDRQMIAGAQAIRLAGVVASESRRAGKQAGDVAMVGTHPAIINNVEVYDEQN